MTQAAHQCEELLSRFAGSSPGVGALLRVRGAVRA